MTTRPGVSGADPGEQLADAGGGLGAVGGQRQRVLLPLPFVASPVSSGQRASSARVAECMPSPSARSRIENVSRSGAADVCETAGMVRGSGRLPGPVLAASGGLGAGLSLSCAVLLVPATPARCSALIERGDRLRLTTTAAGLLRGTGRRRDVVRGGLGASFELGGDHASEIAVECVADQLLDLAVVLGERRCHGAVDGLGQNDAHPSDCRNGPTRLRLASSLSAFALAEQLPVRPD